MLIKLTPNLMLAFAKYMFQISARVKHAYVIFVKNKKKKQELF